MTFPTAMLRAGFPYLTTRGMRRVTTFPMDTALGSEGRIYVLGRTELGVGGNVRIINWEDEDLGTIADGVGGGQTPLTPSGHPMPAAKGLVWPVCLITDEDENLWISDEGAHTITAFTRSGDPHAQWGEFGDGPGQLNRPSGIAFDADGKLLVVDSWNHRVQRFARDGTYIDGFGSHGQGDGELDMPWGIALDAEQSIYIGDWRNDRVQKFDAAGKFMLSIGSSGSGNGEFNRPAGVAVDADGDIYVADRGNNRVQLFDKNGRYVEQFGGDATISKMGLAYIRANQKTLRLREMTSLEPQKLLRGPASVRVDDEGHLYIADFGSHRIQIYKKEAYALGADEILPELRSPTLSTT